MIATLSVQLRGGTPLPGVGVADTIGTRQLLPRRWVCWNLGGRYYLDIVPEQARLASKR